MALRHPSLDVAIDSIAFWGNSLGVFYLSGFGLLFSAFMSSISGVMFWRSFAQELVYFRVQFYTRALVQVLFKDVRCVMITQSKSVKHPSQWWYFFIRIGRKKLGFQSSALRITIFVSRSQTQFSREFENRRICDQVHETNFPQNVRYWSRASSPSIIAMWTPPSSVWLSELDACNAAPTKGRNNTGKSASLAKKLRNCNVRHSESRPKLRESDANVTQTLHHSSTRWKMQLFCCSSNWTKMTRNLWEFSIFLSYFWMFFNLHNFWNNFF